MNGVTWKVMKKALIIFGILITIVGYNLHPLNSHTLHTLHFMEHPNVGVTNRPADIIHLSDILHTTTHTTHYK